MNKEKVKEIFLGYNLETQMSVINELNFVSDFALDQFDYNENDEKEINQFFKGENPSEMLRMVSYGDYRYWDDLFKIDGAGNLESIKTVELKKEIEEDVTEIIDVLEEYYEKTSIIHDVRFLELEEALQEGE